MTVSEEKLADNPRNVSQFNMRASRVIQDNFRSNWRKFNNSQIGSVSQAEYLELLIESCDGMPIRAAHQ